jgi:hypothetical protein
VTDDELRPNLAELAKWERRVGWLYLDTKGNPTIGVGCLIFDVDEYAALPLVGPSGLAASDAEKRADFLRVHRMTPGLLDKRYRGGLSLPEDGIDQLGFERSRETIVGLKRWFPGFDGYPLPARQALLDLGWNCGTGPKLPGLGAWTHLQNACNLVPPDFTAASGECVTTSSREERNAWRVACFQLAARASLST